MSRIGKLPVEVPKGVKCNVAGGVVDVEGPRGKLSVKCASGINVEVVDGSVICSLVGSDAQSKANFGSMRAIINNMVLGVSEGWKKNLEFQGVGYVAKLQGNQLVLSVGFSHDVILDVPSDVKCVVAKTTVDLESCNKQSVGTFAAKIRQIQPPEPYLGKGIRYAGEKVRRKAGKTGKK